MRWEKDKLHFEESVVDDFVGDFNKIEQPLPNTIFIFSAFSSAELSMMLSSLSLLSLGSSDAVDSADSEFSESDDESDDGVSSSLAESSEVSSSSSSTAREKAQMFSAIEKMRQKKMRQKNIARFEKRMIDRIGRYFCIFPHTMNSVARLQINARTFNTFLRQSVEKILFFLSEKLK